MSTEQIDTANDLTPEQDAVRKKAMRDEPMRMQSILDSLVRSAKQRAEESWKSVEASGNLGDYPLPTDPNMRTSLMRGYRSGYAMALIDRKLDDARRIRRDAKNVLTIKKR